MAVWAETAPWTVLGPLNMFKVAWVNRGSPVANYIVVPPAETCQAECRIARMWAVLFWGLQTAVSVAILRRALQPRAAALAKTVVGVTLCVAFYENVVREIVAAAGIVHLLAAACLAAGVPAESPFRSIRDLYVKLRGIVAQFGIVWIVVHWVCYGATILAFWLALGAGVDVASYAHGVPLVGDALATKLDGLDTANPLTRLSVAWACAFATAPLRLVSDLLLTLLIGTLLRKARNKPKKA
ncbi:hypothetical protein CTAYLR_009454 [Chrysophaeum taylorii]|uniref:DUF1279 domain-containing protein n=1 Tax=Chrysophaeum taylorii TaxID=2483200 RepID=A0AAD7U649_9STRA|nr:hypothetical protein CTAYLR_009454 [Chrysophaeum taylorii]